MPPHVTIPAFTSFDGTTDPNAHLLTYRGETVTLRAWPHLILRLFTCSLSGGALHWYQTLPNGCVDDRLSR